MKISENCHHSNLFSFNSGDNNSNVSWLVNIHQIVKGMQNPEKNNSRNVIKKEDEKPVLCICVPVKIPYECFQRKYTRMKIESFLFRDIY